jgi:hypothetical protein
MPQLDVICDLGVSFNVDNFWMSWTLDIETFFWQFWPYPILVGPGTHAIGKFISSSFCAYVAHPNPISYASCTSI